MRTRSGAPRTVVACAAVGAMALVTTASGGLLAPPQAQAQAVCLPIVCTPAPASPLPPAPTPVPAPLPDPAGASAAVPPAAASQVAEYGDPQHTSHAADADLAPPLQVRWTRRLEGVPGPVVAGDGRMFAAVGDTVRAYDTGTGRTLWTVAGRAVKLGYDAGHVVLSGDSGLVALSATDGHELWRFPVTAYGAYARFVATAGTVYAAVFTGTSRIVALGGATGRTRWSVEGRESDFVTVDQDRVYTQSGCGVSALLRTTGARLWTTAVGCGDTSTGPASIFGGRLYAPAGGDVLDTGGGAHVGSTAVPAGTGNGVFAEGIGVHLIDGDSRLLLRARRGGTGRVAWTRTVSKDDRVDVRSVPVGVDGVVYVVVNNELSGYTIRGGRLVVRGTLDGPSGIGKAPPRIVPLGGGRMLVAFGTRAYALQSVLRPGAREVSAAAVTSDVLIGPRTVLQGRVGTSLRRARVLVQADAAPFGGGWRTIARVRPGSDGRFTARLRLDRNTRLRVRAAGSRASSAGTVYVYPRLTLRLAAAGRTFFRARYTVRGPRSLSLRGRRMVLYLARPSAKSYRRLAVGRLAKRGAGRHAGSVRVRRLSRVGRNDRFVVCIAGGPRLGLGRGYFEERCGRSRIALR